MVKDHGRAEDVTQEVFVSALRRMRATERPIAFKPWIYEIAKNACIDQFRRSKRAEEVSLRRRRRRSRPPTTAGSWRRPGARRRGRRQAGARRPVRRVRRPVGHAPRDPRAARARGPLLPRDRRAHGHEPPGRREHAVPRPPAADRGVRRAASRRALPARSSDLSRPRPSARSGTREQRRLARHVAHCQPCRREALPPGSTPRSSRTSRCASAPRRRSPACCRSRSSARRGGGSGDGAPGLAASSSGPGWMTHVPMLSDQLSGGWGKLATAAAVLVAGVGAAGVGTKVAGGHDGRPRPSAPPRRRRGVRAARPRRPSGSARWARGQARRAHQSAGRGGGRSAPRHPERQRRRAPARPRRPRALPATGGRSTPAASTAGAGRRRHEASGGELPAAGGDPVAPVRRSWTTSARPSRRSSTASPDTVRRRHRAGHRTRHRDRQRRGRARSRARPESGPALP